MASNSEGPFPCHAMTAASLAALAAQVVDMALKSAMLRLQGLTHEEIVGHHFSVLHRRLQHAAVRHTKEDLPGDVCDMERLKSIYLATHPTHSSAHEVATQHQRNGLCMKDAKRAGVIARQIFDWVKALSESLQDIPGKGKGEARDTKVRELEEDGISSGGSSGSYGHDFEDDSPNSALETREIKETRRNQRMPVEVWTASELKEEALPKVSFMPAEPEEDRSRQCSLFRCMSLRWDMIVWHAYAHVHRVKDVQPEETVLLQPQHVLCRRCLARALTEDFGLAVFSGRFGRSASHHIPPFLGFGMFLDALLMPKSQKNASLCRGTTEDVLDMFGGSDGAS